MKCSVASVSISSQRPAFFSPTLQSKPMIHRHTEIWKWQGSPSASPLIQEILLSLQIKFSFVRAAVACAILQRISGLGPSSETPALRYLKLVTVPSFCPFTIISLSSLISIRDFLLGLLTPALPQLEHLSHCKPQIGKFSPAYAYLSIMFFQNIRHDPLEKNVEEGGWQKIAWPFSDCCSEPSPMLSSLLEHGTREHWGQLWNFNSWLMQWAGITVT